MKLPNAHLARVEQSKSPNTFSTRRTASEASKAAFFSSFGFRVEDWGALAAALREHGQKHEVSNVRETGFGPRYEVDGDLQVRDGRRPRVRTVWQVDHSRLHPVSSLRILQRQAMIKEHDCVVLTQDLPLERLEAGDIGMVVHIHQGGAGYEVDFVTLAGETVAVATLLPSQVRPIARRPRSPIGSWPKADLSTPSTCRITHGLPATERSRLTLPTSGHCFERLPKNSSSPINA